MTMGFQARTVLVRGRLGQRGPCQVLDLGIYLLLVTLALLDGKHTFPASSFLWRLALRAVRDCCCNIIGRDAHCQI
jgi:hypothetical protein